MKFVKKFFLVQKFKKHLGSPKPKPTSEKNIITRPNSFHYMSDTYAFLMENHSLESKKHSLPFTYIGMDFADAFSVKLFQAKKPSRATWHCSFAFPQKQSIWNWGHRFQHQLPRKRCVVLCSEGAQQAKCSPTIEQASQRQPITIKKLQDFLNQEHKL